MPCGTFDKRRGGHRCLTCRKSHLRCDGNQPCSVCRLRGVACVFPVKGATQGTFRLVHVGSNFRATSQVDTPFSWICITASFRSVGLVPLGAVFTSSRALWLSQNDKHVNEAFILVGEAFMAKETGSSSDMGTTNHVCPSLRKRSIQLKQKCLAQRQDGNWHDPFLLSAHLLAIADLLLDCTSQDWRSWIVRVGTIMRTERLEDQSLESSLFSRDLIRLLQLSDVVGSLARSEPVSGPDFAAHLLNSSYDESNVLDHVLSTLWCWAVLEQRIETWNAARDNTNEDVPDNNSNNDNNLEGLEIINTSTTLQLRLISTLNMISSSSTDRYTLPYLYGALVGLSQEFRDNHAAWHSVQCDGLPVMSPAQIDIQSIAVLGWIEDMGSKAALNAVLFLPLTEIIGVEIRRASERERLDRFLENVQARGFGIAAEYRGIISKQWGDYEEGLVRI